MLFTSLAHVRSALARWKDDYNNVRPRSAIGNLPPATYATLSAPGMQRDGTLRAIRGPRPAPLHHRAKQAQMAGGLHLSLDDAWGAGHRASGSRSLLPWNWKTASQQRAAA
ncbi:integrase core domain-containing protein [Enhydrobacter aerosaccus]|uniref:integrase core domain-containing protein n=1 Tax=Enhydrobacter aerosaccus TaxID=225324 RepID=UPI000A2F5B74